MVFRRIVWPTALLGLLCNCNCGPSAQDRVAPVRDIAAVTITLTPDGGVAAFSDAVSCAGKSLFELRFLDGPVRSGSFEGPNQARGKVRFYECTPRCVPYPDQWSVKLEEDGGTLWSADIVVRASEFLGGYGSGKGPIQLIIHCSP